MACLGLVASEPGGRPSPETASLLRQAGRLLVRAQNGDGSLGVDLRIKRPRWPTPYAVLAWSALGQHRQPATRATRFLLTRRGTTAKQRADSPLGHDTTIVGWPWVEGTHSWVEPTAAAVLALRRAGYGDHARVREGLRLLADRPVPSGGWNFGNSTLFGTGLAAQPGPTGWALIASGGRGLSAEVKRGARRFLDQLLPAVRAPRSLALGLLGLGALGHRPAEADAWLEQALDRLPSPSPPDLAFCLLGASPAAVALLGAPPKEAAR